MFIKNYRNWSRIYESSTSIQNVVDKLAAAPELKKGSTDKENVALLQIILKDAGFLTGTYGPLKNGVDGDFGGGTEEALNKLIGKTTYVHTADAETLSTKMEETGKDFSNTLSVWEKVKGFLSKAVSGSMIYGQKIDDYGKSIGITDKSVTNFSGDVKKLNLPESGPIGDIAKSAWANLNVPTRGISGTEGGGVGCAAAVSIIFYRATGLPIMKGRSKNPIELGTASLWTEFTKTSKENWSMIKDWSTDYQPGDIILTSRGAKAGHVGVVVEGGKIISNSSSGFKGDSPGQIELNYSISTWQEVANRNPQQTAIFRYTGPTLDGWGGKPVIVPTGNNDADEISMDKELPVVVVQAPMKYEVGRLPIQPVSLDTLSISPVRPSEIILNNVGEPDLLKSSKNKKK
jgi:hypothetical protein